MKKNWFAKKSGNSFCAFSEGVSVLNRVLFFVGFFLISMSVQAQTENTTLSPPAESTTTAPTEDNTVPQNMTPFKRAVGAICTRQAVCNVSEVPLVMCLAVFDKLAEGKKVDLTEDQAKACEDELKKATCEELDQDIPKACGFIKKLGKK